jgi:hypothetical protein
MGLSWISKEALMRNALVAAGNSRSGALQDCVAPYIQNASLALSSAAIWALERMTGDSAAAGQARLLPPASGEERKDHKNR